MKNIKLQMNFVAKNLIKPFNTQVEVIIEVRSIYLIYTNYIPFHQDCKDKMNNKLSNYYPYILRMIGTI